MRTKISENGKVNYKNECLKYVFFTIKRNNVFKEEIIRVFKNRIGNQYGQK